jgi:acyl-CoA thioester hydrolase
LVTPSPEVQEGSSAWPDIAGRLTEWGHVLPVRVYFEDTDFSGRVYHASFLRFMERGRSDFLRRGGLEHGALAAGLGQRGFFAVRHMTLDFLKPARIDDLLEVETRVIDLRGARLVVGQIVVAAGELLVSAEVTIALVDEQGHPRRLPPRLKSLLGVQPKSSA